MDDKVYVAEKIARPHRDPLDERIFEMRLLAFRQPGQYGIINPHNVFVQQARFMADYECQAPNDTSFFAYYATYAMMNDAQLKSYFSWRTHVRQGIVEETALSAVFVYIYELLNDVGVTSSLDGFEKLAFILKNYAPISDKIVGYLKRWIKDYYLIHAFDVSFHTLLQQTGIESFFEDIHYQTRSRDLTYLYRISNFKFRQSSYYTPERASLLETIYARMIPELELSLKEKGINWVTDLTMSVSTAPIPHTIYASAVHYDVTIPDTKEFRVSDYELYRIDHHQCSVIYPLAPSAASAILLGHLFKRIEYAVKLTLNDKPRTLPKNQAIADKLPTLAGVTPSTYNALLKDEKWWKQIDRTVYFLIKELYPTLSLNEALHYQAPVKIDPHLMQRARADAVAIRDRLIREEDSTPEVVEVVNEPSMEVTPQPVTRFVTYQQHLLSLLIQGPQSKMSLMRELTSIHPSLLVDVVINELNEHLMELLGDNPIMEDYETYYIYEDYLIAIRNLLEEVTHE